MAEDLSGALIPGESLEDDRAADHVASKANGTLTILHAHRTVCGEAAVAPGEEVVNDRLGDQVLLQQQPQYLGAKESLDVPGVEPDERSEGAVGREATVGHEHVDMRVKIEQFSRGLDEPDGSRGDGRAIEVGFEVESQGSPGTAGELAQQFPLVVEAATGDADHDRVYLARPGELYITDTTAKKPKPELLSSFDDAINLDYMDLDKVGNRIFATDQESGSLYLIDLNQAAPTPNLVAGELGPITQFDLAPVDSSLLLLDTAGKRVLTVDCPRESGSCSTPEVFAAIPEFEPPITVARTADGTVWVGDLAAQSLFAFDPDGNVVKVLSSISGFVE